MNTTSKFLIVLVAASMSLSACKKDIVNPAGVPASNANAGSGDFIEFKMDGVQYRINEIQTPAIYSIGIVVSFDSTLNTGTGLTTYGLAIHFINVLGANSLTDALYGFFSNQPISVGNYHTSGPAANIVVPNFMAMVENNNTYVLTNNSTFTFDISTLHSYKGGTIQGSFSAEHLDLRSQSGTVLSSGHNLTDGKFSVTFD